MNDYKSLDTIIGARHFHGKYVSPEVEQVITERRPVDGEFLNGRIVDLENDRRLLILIFDRMGEDLRESIYLPVTLLKQEEGAFFFDACQGDLL